MPIISLFNHKGGVSKTTTTYNLGWMLAEQGYKTLLVDTDPQCNLTSLIADEEKLEDLYNSENNVDIYSCIEPLEKGDIGGIKPASPMKSGHENLYTLYGNILLSEFENQLAFALTASEGVPAVRNLPGSIGEVLRRTQKTEKFDYILVDMSPSVGALNQCLFMSSDYFIVPTVPDFFCKKAIISLSQVIPRWKERSKHFTSDSLTYQFPKNPPKFLGFISQKYRPRNDAPAKSFQRWIDIIGNCVEQELVPTLEKLDMVVDTNGKTHLYEKNRPFNMINISDFNSLIALSQKHKTPVYKLTDSQIEQTGQILTNMKKSRDDFFSVFQKLSERITELAQK